MNKAGRSRLIIYSALLTLLLLAAVMSLPEQVAAAGQGPIRLSGLKVTFLSRKKAYYPKESINGNTITYTIDETAYLSDIDKDCASDMYLKFKTERQGQLVPITYEPCLVSPPPGWTPDDGDWSGGSSSSSGYALGGGGITYQYDGTGNTDYHLYKFRFYKGALNQYDAGDYTDYVLRLKKNPRPVLSDRITLSDVALQIGDSGKLVPVITDNGRVFTFNDTKKKDIESYLRGIGSSRAVLLYYRADAAETYYYENGNSYWDSGDQSGGNTFGAMEQKPYDTDKDYVIFTFALREKPSGGRLTRFTIRIKKWESQYQKESVAPHFNDGIFYSTAYKFGASPVKWSKVPGKTHHREFVVENVTFPYSMTIACAINYRHNATLEGKWITSSGKLYETTLKFTAAKTYYDFVIDPGKSMDSKYETGTKSYWRIRVTGKNTPSSKASTTKAQLTYRLSAKTYNGRSQGINVTPKSGVGKVTAVYYTGTGGTSYKKSTARPTKAGSYAVTVNVAAGSKYKAVSGLALGTFKINKADIAKAGITAANASWTGKQIRPKKFQYSDKDFSISGNATVKSYGANRNIGKGTVRLSGKGNFTGTKTITFKIVPKKTSIARITVSGKKMKVVWKKVHRAQRITKYEVRYRVKGTARWAITSRKSSASSAIIKRLKKGKVYEVQVRSYKNVSGRKYYSAWSRVRASRRIK